MKLHAACKRKQKSLALKREDAYDLLQADYLAQILPIYWHDVPEGTWNGKSIFKK